MFADDGFAAAKLVFLQTEAWAELPVGAVEGELGLLVAEGDGFDTGRVEVG